MSESVGTMLAKDEDYFEYFKNAIDSGTNFIEYSYNYADSAAARLFYIKKSQCRNPNDALVRLLIPYQYRTGWLPQGNSADLESVFRTIKDFLIQEVYSGTEIQDGNQEQLRQDLLRLSGKKENKPEHFVFTSENEWIVANQKIAGILDECKHFPTHIMLTKWQVSFEYFFETKRYFVLYHWITGA